MVSNELIRLEGLRENMKKRPQSATEPGRVQKTAKRTPISTMGADTYRNSDLPSRLGVESSGQECNIPQAFATVREHDSTSLQVGEWAFEGLNTIPDNDWRDLTNVGQRTLATANGVATSNDRSSVDRASRLTPSNCELELTFTSANTLTRFDSQWLDDTDANFANDSDWSFAPAANAHVLEPSI
ncbi:Uu.00g104850.m01.CDS01 [Anthostomella pinea]|uniref:Uu.00g104850.m01.CDS01 n=1 Tax=Anthostomella pinea TaxID=933095 RepID=A0AAI8VDV5_9PEZI|nr:Uu.00g104850.m01.CDS01 [Anthostomella pinea]